MAIFVDTSVWFASAVKNDAGNARAQEILSGEFGLATSEAVLLETWMLLRSRVGYQAADRFWELLRRGVALIEPLTPADYEEAWHIGGAFADQQFSIVDRTSFAVMQRLGLDRAASFDEDFLIFRYGPGRKRAFTVVR